MVTVTAVDTLGLQRDLTVTINIDSQPPVISLTSPTANVSATDTTVAMTGSVSDSGSGLMSASCNHQWANPNAGAFSCSVPLVPGQNFVIASAVDLAGNSASVGIRATRVTPPTALSISPTTITLNLGDAKVLNVTSDTGLPATGLTWESSNPSVVAIGPDNDGTITAETLGVATITASMDGLTAEATVRVFPDGVALGESIWTSAPTPGRFFTQAPMKANPVLASDPDLFTVEADMENPGTGVLVVRGVRGADGATLSTQMVDQSNVVNWSNFRSPVADAFGGLLVKSRGGVVLPYPELAATTLRRIGGGDVAPWEYVSTLDIGSVASAPDGTVFFVEYGIGERFSGGSRFPDGGYNGVSSIVALDGRTGYVKFRMPIPTRGIWEFTERTNEPESPPNEDTPYVEPIEHCQVANRQIRDPGSFGQIVVFQNGDAYVQQTVQWS